MRRFWATPPVGYVVHPHGVTLVTKDLKPVCSLPHPYAAMWDFLVRGYRWEECIRRVSAINDWDMAKTEAHLRSCLRQWHAAGLLKPGIHGEHIDHNSL